MPADSVLAHYTAQLVSGGWRADGKAASTDDIGVQRFSFRDGQDDWMAALLIMAVGDLREIRLEFAKRQ